MPAFELTSPEGKKYRVEGPEGATQEDAYRILQQQLGNQPKTWTEQAESFGTGIKKGLAGDVVGAGQLLDPIGQVVAPNITSSIEKMGKPLSDYAMTPSSGWAESAGNVIGGATPFILAPEAGLGSLTGRVGLGALAGGLQPTQSGTAASHIPGAIGGAAGGAALAPKFIERATRGGTGLATLAAVEAMARQFGVSPWLAAEATGLPLYMMFKRPTWLSKYAEYAASQLPSQASGAAGAAAGQGAGKVEEMAK